MELRQIEYALAVVDFGGFTRAAEALHVTQPSLSHGVRVLEADLGAVLFHRLGRQVTPTAAGEAFLEPARQLVRDARVVRDAVAAVAGLSAGRLDLVALPTLAVVPMTELIGRFRAAHPQIAVRLVEPEDAGDVEALVRSGQCEVGLAELPLADGRLAAHDLLEQEVLAVSPPGTVDQPVLDVQRLATMPLVTTPPGTSTRRLLEGALVAAAIEPRIAVETGQREAILPLVLAGAGTAFLPEAAALEARRAGAVISRLRPSLNRRVGLVHRDGPLSPAARAFVALALTHAVADRPGAPPGGTGPSLSEPDPR